MKFSSLPIQYNALSILSWTIAIFVTGCVGYIAIFLLVKGYDAISPSFLFGSTNWQHNIFKIILGKKPVFDGLWPAVAGTCWLVVLSAILYIPVGIATAIYLRIYAKKGLARLINLCVDILAGIPSILMGLLGYMIIIFLRKTFHADVNTSLWLASLCLAALVLPYQIRTTEASIASVPQEMWLAGFATGFSRWQLTRFVLLPLSTRGIASGIVLSAGRTAQDVAVILLTGVAANAGAPRGLGDKFEAIPFNIYYLSSQYRDEHELKMAFGASLILFVITGLFYSLNLLLTSDQDR